MVVQFVLIAVPQYCWAWNLFDDAKIKSYVSMCLICIVKDTYRVVNKLVSNLVSIILVKIFHIEKYVNI